MVWNEANKVPSQFSRHFVVHKGMNTCDFVATMTITTVLCLPHSKPSTTPRITKVKISVFCCTSPCFEQGIQDDSRYLIGGVLLKNHLCEWS